MKTAYYTGRLMDQINKQKARRLYNEGKTIYAIPNKASRSYGEHKHNGKTVGGIFWTSFDKYSLEGQPFDDFVNQYMHYSPSELGSYLNYYILKENQEEIEKK